MFTANFFFFLNEPKVCCSSALSFPTIKLSWCKMLLYKFYKVNPNWLYHQSVSICLSLSIIMYRRSGSVLLMIIFFVYSYSGRRELTLILKSQCEITWFLNNMSSSSRRAFAWLTQNEFSLCIFNDIFNYFWWASLTAWMMTNESSLFLCKN